MNRPPTEAEIARRRAAIPVATPAQERDMENLLLDALNLAEAGDARAAAKALHAVLDIREATRAGGRSVTVIGRCDGDEESFIQMPLEAGESDAAARKRAIKAMKAEAHEVRPGYDFYLLFTIVGDNVEVFATC